MAVGVLLGAITGEFVGKPLGICVGEEVGFHVGTVGYVEGESLGE